MTLQSPIVIHLGRRGGIPTVGAKTQQACIRICKFQPMLVKVLESNQIQINKAAGWSLERSLPWTLNFNESPTNSHSWSKLASTSICALGWAVQRLICLQKEDFRQSYILYTSPRAHQRYRSGINRRVVLSYEHVQVEAEPQPTSGTSM